MRREEICARCDEFSIKDDPARAAQGIGRCKGYDGARHHPVPSYVAWNGRTCIVFRMEPDIRPRERWIKLQRERTGEVQP